MPFAPNTHLLLLNVNVGECTYQHSTLRLGLHVPAARIWKFSFEDAGKGGSPTLTPVIAMDVDYI